MIKTVFRKNLHEIRSIKYDHNRSPLVSTTTKKLSFPSKISSVNLTKPNPQETVDLITFTEEI